MQDKKERIKWEKEDIDTHISEIIGEEVPKQFIKHIDNIFRLFKFGDTHYSASHVLASTDYNALMYYFPKWEMETIQEIKKLQKELDRLQKSEN